MYPLVTSPCILDLAGFGVDLSPSRSAFSFCSSSPSRSTFCFVGHYFFLSPVRPLSRGPDRTVAFFYPRPFLFSNPDLLSIPCFLFRGRKMIVLILRGLWLLRVQKGGFSGCEVCSEDFPAKVRLRLFLLFFLQFKLQPRR